MQSAQMLCDVRPARNSLESLTGQHSISRGVEEEPDRSSQLLGRQSFVTASEATLKEPILGLILIEFQAMADEDRWRTRFGPLLKFVHDRLSRGLPTNSSDTTDAESVVPDVAAASARYFAPAGCIIDQRGHLWASLTSARGLESLLPRGAEALARAIRRFDLFDRRRHHLDSAAPGYVC